MNWSTSRYAVFRRLEQEITGRIEDIIEIGRKYTRMGRGTYSFQSDYIEVEWTTTFRGYTNHEPSYTIPAELLWQDSTATHAYFAAIKASEDAKKVASAAALKRQEEARERAELERLRAKFEA